jgi:hypothetical protein
METRLLTKEMMQALSQPFPVEAIEWKPGVVSQDKTVRWPWRMPIAGTTRTGLLSKVVVWVELGKERGKIAYTFPLRDADLYTVPPGGSCI